jgi:hypothetical protein
MGCGLAYELRPVSGGRGEQFDPGLAYIANSRIAVLGDPGGQGGRQIFAPIKLCGVSGSESPALKASVSLGFIRSSP